MSFGYSVGDVLAVIALANKILRDFVGAPEQFKSINQDVRSLSIIIQDAYANLDQISEGHAGRFSEILDTCQTLLHKLESMISKWSVVSDTSKGKTVQKMWKRLRWEPDEISDLRMQITSKITLLNAFNDQATSQNVAKLVRRNNNDEKQAILDWVNSIDYTPQQHHLVSRLQVNSRRWLFDSKEYQNWDNQRGRVLFCPGDPGTGKTFTTAIVLETLQVQSKDDPEVLNTFVYCTYQALDQDVHGLISSLFRNSLQQSANIPDAIFTQCRQKRSAKQTLLRDEVIKLLKLLYSSFRQVNLLVDALDEVPTDVSQPFIAEILKLQRTCQLNLFVARDPSFQIEIIERITAASSGMFLLAELHLRSLKNKKSPKALRTSLAKLSVGSDAYDSAYQDAMTRIAGLGPESEALAKQALLILIFAREPLSTEDLAYALSVEPDSDVIDIENVPDIEDVAGSNKNAEAMWPPFRRYSDMNWAYHSHRAEYDHEVAKGQQDDADKSVMVSNMHSVSALAIDMLVRDMNGGLPSALDKACREGHHGLVDLLLIVNDYDLNCQPCTGSRESTSPEDDTWTERGSTSHVDQDSDSEYSLIMEECVAFDSSTLLARDYELQKGTSLLIMASGKGDDAMVRVLLDHGADPNLVSISGFTALYISAEKGHERTVSLLLEQRNIKPDCKYRGSKSTYGWYESLCWTPLLAAAYYGHLKCVKLLLDHSQRNYRDSSGMNAACLAAEKGNIDVLKELMKWSDVELDPMPGTRGSSALDVALKCNNEKTALALIPHSNVNYSNGDVDGPLQLAATAKYGDAIRLLFSRGAQVNAKALDGRTALHNAAMTGDEQTIKLILSHPDINVNICDDNGNTALFLAARWVDSKGLPKHDNAFNTLLHHPGVHKEHRNNLGQTILVQAVVAGSHRVQTIAKETELSYQFCEVDCDGETILSLAAKSQWMSQLTWKFIVDMSPSEFMSRKDGQGRTPEDVRSDNLKKRRHLEHIWGQQAY
ncbi:hypothetical protein FAUST_10605 [Fusarium austroamericanum]|uniref:Nephrocystin 3-like N-terminal domain-containing protein n=1 Tax=Fusarium austroamericanum TaxID=282268 RepID=A0AAN5Z0T6_FUSAU|nr:hypothetical protein FAUST_10605 [Fusarium austroamericanum]